MLYLNLATEKIFPLIAQGAAGKSRIYPNYSKLFCLCQEHFERGRK
jgi:hypothetical protein